jgi:hypothetical protein
VRHRAVIASQGDVGGVRMATESGARFKQGGLGVGREPVGGGQACNAGADNGDFHSGLRTGDRATGKKKVAKRPDAKKRGREEKRLGISFDPPGAERLRNMKLVRHFACRMSVWSSSDRWKFQEFRR